MKIVLDKEEFEGIVNEFITEKYKDVFGNKKLFIPAGLGYGVVEIRVDDRKDKNDE